MARNAVATERDVIAGMAINMSAWLLEEQGPQLTVLVSACAVGRFVALRAHTRAVDGKPGKSLFVTRD